MRRLVRFVTVKVKPIRTYLWNGRHDQKLFFDHDSENKAKKQLENERCFSCFSNFACPVADPEFIEGSRVEGCFRDGMLSAMVFVDILTTSP